MDDLSKENHVSLKTQPPVLGWRRNDKSNSRKSFRMRSQLIVKRLHENTCMTLHDPEIDELNKDMVEVLHLEHMFKKVKKHVQKYEQNIASNAELQVSFFPVLFVQHPSDKGDINLN